MKYELCFTCVSTDGERETMNYNVWFSYDPDQYGNGTMMICKKKDSRTEYYDIRYNRDYHKNEQMQFILNWVLNTWSGERGSWRATEVSIKEVADE